MTIRTIGLPLACTLGAFGLGWFVRGRFSSSDHPSPQDPMTIGATAAAVAARDDRRIADVLWPDRTHEVEVIRSPDMHDTDLYHLGTWPDRDNSDPDFRVTVKSTVGRGTASVVEVEHSNGFGHRLVTLRFDAVTHGVEVQIDSHGDTYPQPPDRWEDVSGIVYASDMEWGLGHAVILDYALYGVRGGQRRCVHDKVSVDL